MFAWLTDTFKLSRVIPGVFWFLALNLVGFYFWFEATPDSRWLQASFYWWVSVNNLFMISVFWSLMVDVFTSAQASRMLPTIAAGGSLGAIAGPLVASLFVKSVGVPVLLLIAAAGLVGVIVCVHLLMREKEQASRRIAPGDAGIDARSPARGHAAGWLSRAVHLAVS